MMKRELDELRKVRVAKAKTAKPATPNPSWNYPPGEGAMPKAYNPSRGDRRIIAVDFVYFQRRNERHGAWELIGQRGVTQQEKDDMSSRYFRENPDPS